VVVGQLLAPMARQEHFSVAGRGDRPLLPALTVPRQAHVTLGILQVRPAVTREENLAITCIRQGPLLPLLRVG